MRKYLLLLLLFTASYSIAQVSEPFKDLRDFIKSQPPKIGIDSTPFLDMYYKNGIHYLLPLYKAFLQEQKKIPKDNSLFYEMIAQAVSFIGDNKTVLEYEKASYEKLPDSARPEISRLTDIAKDVTYTDAKQYILGRAKTNRVVMINESQDKPLTHAFTASLLEDLYQQGFRYLAMEMLHNSRYTPLTKLSASTGYYATEPVAGELIRKALEIGYTLLAYEDTVASHTVNQREYAQAENIYRFLSKKDTSVKILVSASYTHIEEGARSNDRIPMAAYFRIISGIDPLTIDQTEMIESSTSAYGALLYESWIRKHPVTGSVVALSGNKAVDPFDLNLYDIHVIHAPTKYINERPVWMLMDGWKKEIPVSPAYKSLFLVQAYYFTEYSDATQYKAVPADQTYLNAANGFYYLYLHKGKYKIIFRDKLYEVLGTKEIEVY